jgi:exonuclease VII small subunit
MDPRSRAARLGMTQMNLGNALLSLGARESRTARLEEAVSAYREALQELARARAPLQWATTQLNLGIALTTLGARESGTARLEEAVAAYREALKENTRARAARMGGDPDESRRCARNARRAGGRDGAARRSRCRLSRSLEGKYSRARRSNGPGPRAISLRSIVLAWTSAASRVISTIRSKLSMGLSKNFARRRRIFISSRPSASAKTRRERRVLGTSRSCGPAPAKNSLMPGGVAPCTLSRVANVYLARPSIAPKCFMRNILVRLRKN